MSRPRCYYIFLSFFFEVRALSALPFSMEYPSLLFLIFLCQHQSMFPYIADKIKKKIRVQKLHVVVPFPPFFDDQKGTRKIISGANFAISPPPLLSSPHFLGQSMSEKRNMIYIKSRPKHRTNFICTLGSKSWKTQRESAQTDNVLKRLLKLRRKMKKEEETRSSFSCSKSHTQFSL